MMISLCGADCAKCELKARCLGCVLSDGCPFGEKCMVASYCEKGEEEYIAFMKRVMAAFNSLGIEDMDEVTGLFALKGSYVNMPLPLANGQPAQFLLDNRIYLGNQLRKHNSDRCYGLAADEHHLMVCEYGADGSDPELVVYKRWN